MTGAQARTERQAVMSDDRQAMKTRIQQLEELLRSCARRLQDSMEIVAAEVTGIDDEDIEAEKEFISYVQSVAAGARPRMTSAMDGPRFEDQVDIVIDCCRQPMVLGGNLSLREAGAPVTQLAYECEKCFRRVSVVDAWTPPPSPALLGALDAEP
jgi:hypothetical protein